VGRRRAPSTARRRHPPPLSAAPPVGRGLTTSPPITLRPSPSPPPQPPPTAPHRRRRGGQPWSARPGTLRLRPRARAPSIAEGLEHLGPLRPPKLTIGRLLLRHGRRRRWWGGLGVDRVHLAAARLGSCPREFSAGGVGFAADGAQPRGTAAAAAAAARCDCRRATCHSGSTTYYLIGIFSQRRERERCTACRTMGSSVHTQGPNSKTAAT
jgi:hypothetical protein